MKSKNFIQDTIDCYRNILKIHDETELVFETIIVEHLMKKYPNLPKESALDWVMDLGHRELKEIYKALDLRYK